MHPLKESMCIGLLGWRETLPLVTVCLVGCRMFITLQRISKQYQGDVPSVYFAITWSIDSLHLYSRHGAAISVALARPACPVGDVKIILMFCLCKAVVLQRQGVRIRCLYIKASGNLSPLVPHHSEYSGYSASYLYFQLDPSFFSRFVISAI